MKEKLELLGWTCASCNCPGRRGHDCAHNDHRGFMIKTGKDRFKLYKHGMLIESGFAWELEGKMKKQGILQP